MEIDSGGNRKFYILKKDGKRVELPTEVDFDLAEGDAEQFTFDATQPMTFTLEVSINDPDVSDDFMMCVNPASVPLARRWRHRMRHRNQC